MYAAGFLPAGRSPDDRRNCSQKNTMDLSFPAMVSGISDFPGPVQRTGSSDLQLPGNFISLLAWSMAGGVLLGIPLCTVLLRRLLPEKEIRLELLFLTHSLTAFWES